MGKFLLPLLGAVASEFVDLPFIGPPAPDSAFVKRRRRRRMLTASDRGDIAFLSATLGKSSAKELAAIRLARV